MDIFVSFYIRSVDTSVPTLNSTSTSVLTLSAEKEEATYQCAPPPLSLHLDYEREDILDQILYT
jgi:hypothetical protein